jgi:hypothetical protein
LISKRLTFWIFFFLLFCYTYKDNAELDRGAIVVADEGRMNDDDDDDDTVAKAGVLGSFDIGVKAVVLHMEVRMTTARVSFIVLFFRSNV